MEKKKPEKGDYGYLKRRQRFEIIKTVILFAICLAVYITGYIQAGKRENLLTVVAIVGVLPASKSAVSMIMFVRYRQTGRQLYDKLKPYTEKGELMFDLIFILNQKAVKTECVVAADGNLVVYTKNTDFTETQIAKQLKNFLGNNGKGNYGVKVCVSEKAFLEQALSRLNASDRSEEMRTKDREVRAKLFAFSM